MDKKDDFVLVHLSDEILRYLQTYPKAADTVEGIVEWWLPRQRHEEAVHRVQYVLDELVTRGMVKRITLVDGTVLYADLVQPSFPPQRATFNGV